MANGLFIPDFRGAGSPGAPGVGSTVRGLETARQAQQLTQQQQIGLQGTSDQARIDSLVRGSVLLKQIPPERKEEFLQGRIQQLEANNIDSSDTREALALAQSGDFAALEELTDQAISLGQPQVKAEAGFTLSPGQQRFGPSGELLAEVAPEVTETAEIAPDIPQELLVGLDPQVSSKGAAAFKAAGGGDKGLTAFQKTVDQGTEQQRRIASPQILSQSFPKASQAENVQLQAVMDAAKTTEAGLKAAGKVREEQRRDKKGKAFQTRSLQLLNGILENPELDDVLGSVEGAIDFRLQDSEAELISDIEETGNILTADNLSLMSGVLSETDIKILANLAGGALNRKRSPERFKADVTKLRDKIASQLIVTADDTAVARGAATQQATPTAPPSGRQGGQLMTDAQGNRAFVFPDGTIEEVQ